MERLAGEVVERGESADDGGQCRGNLRIVGVGVVGLAVDRIFVNLGVEGVAQLCDAAGELNGTPAGIDFGDGEAMAAKPGFDGGDVLVGGSKLCAELVRGEPLVVVRRTRRVHLRDELAESGLLVGASLKDQLHAVKLHAVGRSATVIHSVGQRTHRVGECHPLAFVDGIDDANCWAGTLCL